MCWYFQTHFSLFVYICIFSFHLSSSSPLFLFVPILLLILSSDIFISDAVVFSFLSGSDSKESACSVGDLGLIPGSGRSPGRGHGNPLQYSCLENSHRQRSLAGYSPWGQKESDMTEQLSTDTLDSQADTVDILKEDLIRHSE